MPHVEVDPARLRAAAAALDRLAADVEALVAPVRGAADTALEGPSELARDLATGAGAFSWSWQAALRSGGLGRAHVGDRHGRCRPVRRGRAVGRAAGSAVSAPIRLHAEPAATEESARVLRRAAAALDALAVNSTRSSPATTT